MLTPPNSSPTGSVGIEKAIGAAEAAGLFGTSADKIPFIGEATGAAEAAVILGISDDKILFAGETTGAGAGAHEAGGGALNADECL